MGLKADHITLLVSSIKESMPYYDTLLPIIGFDKLRDHVWTDGDGFYIQFNQAKSNTRPYERYGPGLNHIGFSAPSSETVDLVRAQMKAAGFPVPEIQNLKGAVALFMKDPDGIRFEVTYYPPGVSVVD
jgi:catechol 2,3-dioxygenase-like lactoylglutathione lyase family enzyme